MVHLVLDDPGVEPLGLDLEVLPVLVLGPHRHRRGTLDLDVDARQAQAALLAEHELIALPLELRVDEHRQRVVEVGAVDEHAVQDPDLRRRQADAQRVVHQLPHPRGLGGEPLVKALDRERAGPQDGVAQLAHLRQGRVAARPYLGVELLRGALLALDLDVLLLGAGRLLELI